MQSVYIMKQGYSELYLGLDDSNLLKLRRRFLSMSLHEFRRHRLTVINGCDVMCS